MKRKRDRRRRKASRRSSSCKLSANKEDLQQRSAAQHSPSNPSPWSFPSPFAVPTERMRARAQHRRGRQTKTVSQSLTFHQIPRSGFSSVFISSHGLSISFFLMQLSEWAHPLAYAQGRGGNERAGLAENGSKRERRACTDI